MTEVNDNCDGRMIQVSDVLTEVDDQINGTMGDHIHAQKDDGSKGPSGSKGHRVQRAIGSKGP